MSQTVKLKFFYLLNQMLIQPHQTVYTSSDPIAGGASWTAAADYASEITWQDQVCGNLSTTDRISAGVFFGTSPMSIAGLTAVEGTANNYVKTYCSHNYPQSASTANLATLMGHSNIKSQISGFSSEITAASNMGKPHIFGETNSGKSDLRQRRPKRFTNDCSSNPRWRRYQPDLRCSPLDFGLCYANGDYGHTGKICPISNMTSRRLVTY